MNIKDILTHPIESYKAIQAAALPPVPTPKVPKGPQALPGWRTNATVSTSAVRRPNNALATTDRQLDTRQGRSDYEVIKKTVKNSPELSAAQSLVIRTAIPDNYTVIGYDMDGQISRDITLLAQELLRRLTYMGNVDGSFGVQQGLSSLSESLAVDLQHNGAMCLEVALDKQRIPASMNPIAVSTLTMYEEDTGFRLTQKVGQLEIDLDIPTVIYVTQDQILTEAYPTGAMATAVQPVLADLDFNNSIRRALQRAVLPRLSAMLDSEKIRKMTPPEILVDPDKLAAYNNLLVAQVSNTINGLNPEDALVSFDYVSYSFIEGGHDPSTVIERVQKVLNAKLVAGGKTLPVAMGFGSNSNASSSESLLFLKQANGIRVKLNEAYSRALTVAVRTMGLDGYVDFGYEELDLRPAKELEAYKAMHQSRILEQLSMGFITDEQACLVLTGKLTPNGYVPKSGTMFKTGGTEAVANPNSPTSAMEKNTTPDTPQEPKA